MMSEFRLAAEPREIVGKQVKRLRREGLVPAVIYGKSEPELLQMSDRELRTCFRRGGKDAQLLIDIGGKERMVVVQDLQRHVTRGDLLHIDFLEVSATDTRRTEVPIVFIGRSQLDALGGRIAQLLQTVEVETLVSQMISEVEVDISVIEDPAQMIRVGDLPPLENVTFITDEGIAIAKYEEARAVEEVEEVVEEGEEGEEGAEGAEADGEESAGDES